MPTLPLVPLVSTLTYSSFWDDINLDDVVNVRNLFVLAKEAVNFVMALSDILGVLENKVSMLEVFDF